MKSSQYNNFHSLRRVTNFKQGSVHYKPHRQNLDNFDPFTLLRFLRVRLTYINFGIKIFRLILKPHCGKNSILLICSKNSVGTYIAIRGHPSYWWINKEINFLLLLAHISCNFLKWSHDQEVAWLYIFDPKKFKNLKIYSVTSIFLRNKLSWILKWVVPEGVQILKIWCNF